MKTRTFLLALLVGALLAAAAALPSGSSSLAPATASADGRAMWCALARPGTPHGYLRACKPTKPRCEKARKRLMKRPSYKNWQIEPCRLYRQ